MSRPAKRFTDPKKQAAHERSLERRRARHREARTIEMASRAAEGASDFEALVEAQKQRMETRAQTHGRKGGSQSPKVMSQAREDLAMAFELMGGVAALVVWGRQNPSDFYRIWAKLIPTNAQEASTALPLETLLEKLASKEEKTVGQAAYEIGEELLAKGRADMEREDAMQLDPKEIN